jgi:(5-formylfuran-3-yl)methyl phosphate synthase
LKLLISPQNLQEAQEAIAGGADIIDVKNPKEGPLGANYPWIIKQIADATPANLEVSCTLGEAPNRPASISLAALGAASLGVDYVKVGLCGIKTQKQAVTLLQNVNQAAKSFNPKIKVVAAGYADAKRAQSIDPLLVPETAFKAGVEVAMLDTAVKDGKTLFDFLSSQSLRKFIDLTHKCHLTAAVAGSLRKENLPKICLLGADIAGLRGAACMDGDRVTGHITRDKVQELALTIKQALIETQRV